MLLLQFIAPFAQCTDDTVHGFQCTVAQRGVAGVPGAALQVYRLHHHAFMHVYRPQAGGFTDNRMTRPWQSAFNQCLCASHGGFFVCRGENNEWLFHIPGAQLATCFYCQCQEGLHVGCSQAVKTLIGLCQGKRVVLPFTFIIGNGVGMTRQHQSTAATAQCGYQVGLAAVAGQGHDLDAEPHVGKPAGQLFNDRNIALVE